MWHLSGESDTPLSQSQLRHHYRRQSLCELEGDASVSDIINQQFKMYNSLSQTQSDVRMVQSLVAIWEEEYERTGKHEAAIPPDPGKPFVEDVLKTLSHHVGFENQLKELQVEVEHNLSLSQSNLKPTASSPADLDPQVKPESSDLQVLHHTVDGDSKFSLSAHHSPSKEMNEVLSTEHDAYIRPLTDRDRPEITVSPEFKATDAEALGLLKWLASSQAVEEINSDDELLRESIISPLLPSVSIDKVLVKANTDYESQSQKECQDILDSQEDLPDIGDLNEGASCTDLHSRNPQTLSAKESSETEASGDAPEISISDGSSDNSFQRYTKSDLNKTKVSVKMGRSFCSRRKQSKSMWGPLPFSLTRNLENEFESIRSDIREKFRVTTKSLEAATELRNKSNVSIREPNTDASNAMDVKVLAGCSLRDLMRKKRLCRAESPESEHAKFMKVSTETKDSKDPKKEEWTPSLRSQVKKQEPDFSAQFGEPYYGYVPQTLSAVEVRNSYCNVRGHYSLSETQSAKFHSIDNNSANETVGQNMNPVASLFTVATVPHGGLDSSHDLSEEQRTSLEPGEKVSSNELIGIAMTNTQNAGDEHEHMSAIVIGEAGRLICVTLNRKPPVFDCTNSRLQDSSHSLAIPLQFLHANDKERNGSEAGDSKEIHPFFLEETKVKLDKKKHHVQEASLGVPSHYLNDGSCLYLLTPALSPPSVKSVSQWISNDEGSHQCHVDSEIKPSGDDCGMISTSSASASNVGSICAQVEQHNDVIASPEPNAYPKPKAVSKGKRKSVNLDLRTNVSQDMSQISGPDGESGATPLSQIGFRDPASIGAGQQLAMLSIEIHAESRGDLRPDPRFDAVNIIVLAVQNDNDSAAEVFVLLFSQSSVCQRNIDGLSGCNVSVFLEERQLFNRFIEILCKGDPDILMGWDIQGGSLGFLAERAARLGIRLLDNISRTPSQITMTSGRTGIDEKRNLGNMMPDPLIADLAEIEESVVVDEWGRTHASGVHVGGRIVLNVWRLMRGEVKLNMYTIEAVAEAVLRRKIPSIPYKVLTKWFSSGAGGARYRCIEYVIRRANLNLEIMSQLDMINRTSELARVFGIDFFSVLSRGSQYRVESMFLRLAHTQNYLAISPGNQQVASQPAMECLPLVMEPESGFYSDPVVVLDFQSLYPSMIIGYNLCFCTCLGKFSNLKINTLGVSSYSPEPRVFQDLKNQILLTPNGVMYVHPKVRKGILPRLLEEILSTRVMVKNAMKKLTPSEKVLQRILNARQLALKLISNVTYGSPAAGFSGRMPCAELADSIVQCGRSTLEKAISFVNANDKWKARVVYGDTDSMFVLLKGRTVKEAFEIGQEIASAVTKMNPHPVTLKMEKVYHPCFLLTKKRYVGYSYESRDQTEPLFDAKGIETVRRDTCEAVAKTMEQSLRLFFEHQDISKVKSYLYRQWKRILSGRVSLQDFVFAKEVRLGTYSSRDSSLLPPAAIVATKAMRSDPRAEPRYAERVPYVVVHGEPGARLVDMVVDPLDLLDIDSPYRLNDLYYINKQIIPALQRVFGLVGADLNQWFLEMPRPTRDSIGRRRPLNAGISHRTRIDYYYLSKHCMLCGELVQATDHLCNGCMQKESDAAATIVWRTSKLEKEMQHLAAMCRECGGGDWVVESGVKCKSLACSVFYERRKVQKELRGLSSIATQKQLYPKCMPEWF
ncbi:PREDICTED: DNA polymerase zeta catalytic subunit isoform X2 [Tarenaya hassleriana]|nr:PREDICTED: DNA polymerase zeta catalytic subunit isoform X2 [Tarenaya hassleriana]XP_010553734.1 PREDICTED: DNA polymerase zeta catalytic subunit isoform X2 [Tarenaya hassleriana]